MQLQQPVPVSSMPANGEMPHMQHSPMQNYNPYQNFSLPPHRPRRVRISLRKLVIAVFMLATLGLLGANLYFTINPPYMQTLQLRQQILDEVSRIAVVNIFDENIQMSRVKDADALRKQSGVNAAVYKDAKSGDYAIAFTDKLIIYRREEKRVIYDGDTPLAIAQKQRQEALEKILKKARADKVITVADSELGTPVLEDVGDIAARKKNDPKFFENAKEGDIVGSFPGIRLVLLYRASTDQIINYGTVALSAQK